MHSSITNTASLEIDADAVNPNNRRDQKIEIFEEITIDPLPKERKKLLICKDDEFQPLLKGKERDTTETKKLFENLKCFFKMVKCAAAHILACSIPVSCFFLPVPYTAKVVLAMLSALVLI